MKDETPISLTRNFAGGIDLLTERGADNPIRILTGNPERALDFWQRMRTASKDALEEMGVEQNEWTP